MYKGRKIRTASEQHTTRDDINRINKSTFEIRRHTGTEMECDPTRKGKPALRLTLADASGVHSDIHDDRGSEAVGDINTGSEIGHASLSRKDARNSPRSSQSHCAGESGKIEGSIASLDADGLGEHRPARTLMARGSEWPTTSGILDRPPPWGHTPSAPEQRVQDQIADYRGLFEHHGGPGENSPSDGALPNSLAPGQPCGGNCSRGNPDRVFLPLPQIGSGANRIRRGQASDEGASEFSDIFQDRFQGLATRRSFGPGASGQHWCRDSRAFAPQGRRHPPDLSGGRSARREPGAHTTPPGGFARTQSRNLVRQLCGLALGGGKIPHTIKPATPSEYSLPLHCKSVGRIRWEVADAKIIPELRHTWMQAKEALLAPARLQSLLRGHAPELSVADIAPNDLEHLVAFGYVEKLPRGDTPLGAVRVFTVLEKPNANGYTRRRFIAVPDALNELNLGPGEVELPGVPTLTQALKFDHAKTGDFVAFFTQFELPSEARNYYTFAAFNAGRIELYRCTTICTGQRQCPCLAQCLATSVVTRALAAANATDTCQGDAYIDNIRISGPVADVEFAWVCLLREIDELNFEFLTSGVNYEFLGIRFHHAEKTTAATTKALLKLQARSKEALDVPETCSLRQLLRLVGELLWISRVASVRLARFYGCIKNVRRKCGVLTDAQLDEPLGVIWESTAELWREWVNVALRNEPRHFVLPRDVPLQTCIFSDASLEGWAATIIRDHPLSLSIFFGPWGQETLPHINVLEASALANGCAHLPQARPGEILLAFIDNTTVVTACRHESSANYHLHSNVNAALTETHRHGYLYWRVCWVGTLRNIADHFTRMSRYICVS